MRRFTFNRPPFFLFVLLVHRGDREKFLPSQLTELTLAGGRDRKVVLHQDCALVDEVAFCTVSTWSSR